MKRLIPSTFPGLSQRLGIGAFPSTRDQPPRNTSCHEAPVTAGSPVQAQGPSTRAAGLPFIDGPGVQKLPGYELLEKIGEGGMGVVYRARQQALGRVVAVKLLRGGNLAGAEELRREAQAIARLRHPHFIQIHDVGEYQGQTFLALEYVDGGTLAARIGGKPQPPRAAAELLVKLAHAVHQAHTLGLIHRDLKPANVLLESSGSNAAYGQPRITDFGLVKEINLSGPLTHETTVAGTPPYMAPEQFRGQGKVIGPATDIYALGCILYEMLTGRPPFRGATWFDTMEQVCTRDPVPPRRLQPLLPRDLETICLKCLEKRPEQRYSSAVRFAEDLQRFLEYRPILARRSGTIERAGKWIRRQPTAAALVAVCLVAASALSGLGLAISQQSQRHLATTRTHLSDLLDQAHAHLEAGDVILAQSLLEQASPLLACAPGRLADLRAEVVRLRQSCDQATAEQQTNAAALHDLAMFRRQREEAIFLSTFSFPGADRTASQRKCLEVAQAGVQRFLPRLKVSLPLPLQTAQAEILAGCYELLLIQAEMHIALASEQPLKSRQLAAHNALKLLDEAAALGLQTRALYLRRQRYCDLVGDEQGARQAQVGAEKTPALTALDFYLLGDDAFNRQQYAEARRAFDAVVALQPTHFWGRYFLALCHLGEEHWSEARASLDLCIGYQPQVVWPWLMRAFVRTRMEDRTGASRDFDQALSLAHDMPDALYILYANRAALHLQEHRLSEAKQDLHRAITLDAARYEAWAALGGLHQEQARCELLAEVAGCLTPGLTLIGSIPCTQFLRRTSLIEAKRCFDEAIALQPNHALLFRQRARIEEALGAGDRALADVRQALACANPGDRVARARLKLMEGRLLKQAQRLADADAAFVAAASLDPTLKPALLAHAEVAALLGEFDQAEAALTAYIEHGGPVESAAYRGRARLALQRQQPWRAIEDLTLALRITKGNDAELLLERGWVYVSCQAYKLAEQDFGVVSGRDPNHAEALLGRAFVRIKLASHWGEVAAAVRDANRANALRTEDTLVAWRTASVHAAALDWSRRLPPTDLTVERVQIRLAWERQALALLQRALSVLPEVERARFWQERIVSDATLAPLRWLHTYQKLEARYAVRQAAPLAP